MNKFIFLADTMNTMSYDSNDGVAVAAVLTFILFALIFAFTIVVFVFWVIALIHLIQHEDVKDRELWLALLFVFGGIIGPVYYFAIKKPYDREKSLPKKTTK